MANVELDNVIVGKLESAFEVSREEVFALLDFFNAQALSFTSCCKYRRNNQR